MKNKVVDLSQARRDKTAQEAEASLELSTTESYEETQAACYVCPECQGVEFAAQINKIDNDIDYLICMSDECDGDSYVDVENGVIIEEVAFTFTPDQ